ncbi:uncharacterized protein BdWA1_003530 [Babesia duncani]|uniref:Uncharacterized protein n=1 Tax=Babesia duncani TaxID=323732 RepID=A0AAD9PID5_9APIC|nr:hypothetical protein BdWA1_003530 [Babesia duncani]
MVACVWIPIHKQVYILNVMIKTNHVALLALIVMLNASKCVYGVRKFSIFPQAAYTCFRPFLRKPQVRNRISREERKRRSSFSKQLHREMRLKYWKRHAESINELVPFDNDIPDVDPRRYVCQIVSHSPGAL